MTCNLYILSFLLIAPVLVHPVYFSASSKYVLALEPMYNVDSTDLIHFCTIKSGFTQEKKDARHKR